MGVRIEFDDLPEFSESLEITLTIRRYNKESKSITADTTKKEEEVILPPHKYQEVVIQPYRTEASGLPIDSTTYTTADIGTSKQTSNDNQPNSGVLPSMIGTF